MARKPYGALSLLSRLRDHTQTHHIHQDSSGRVISSSQRPLPDYTQHTHAPAGFEPTIPASERQSFNALDREATGIGVETAANQYTQSEV